MIDTHCHLYMADAFPDPAQTVAEAVSRGVTTLVVIGIDVDTSEQAIALAERFPEVYATVGHHPTNAHRYSHSDGRRLRELSEHEKVVAIGEIGLDFYWDTSSPAQQEACLSDQLALADEEGLPIVFHCRNAVSTLLERLDDLPPVPFVFHCFSGDREQAERIWAHGGLIGVDGPVTFPKSEELREIVRACPRDRLLIETDAPYLAPQSKRGKQSSPGDVAEVLAKVAEVWGVTRDEADVQTTANAKMFFRLP